MSSLRVANFGVPEKWSGTLCICFLCWRNISIQGKGTLFRGRETQFWPPFRGHPGTQYSPVKMATAFKTWTTYLAKVDVLNLWEFIHNIADVIKSWCFFQSYLPAWNNDCCRFPGRIKIYIFFLCWLIQLDQIFFMIKEKI